MNLIEYFFRTLLISGLPCTLLMLVSIYIRDYDEIHDFRGRIENAALSVAAFIMISMAWWMSIRLFTRCQEDPFSLADYPYIVKMIAIILYLSVLLTVYLEHHYRLETKRRREEEAFRILDYYLKHNSIPDLNRLEPPAQTNYWPCYATPVDQIWALREAEKAARSESRKQILDMDFVAAEKRILTSYWPGMPVREVKLL